MTDNICISLSRAIECILAKEPFSPTPRHRPTQFPSFPEHAPEFERLLQALCEGEIQAFGELSILRLDRPEYEPSLDCDGEWTSILQRTFRNSPNYIVGMMSEEHVKEIPAECWSYDQAVWEHSILWIDPEQACLSSRVAAIPEHNIQFSHLKRPYEFERICGFTNVGISLSDITKCWSSVSQQQPNNPNRAGVAPKADYHEVAQFLTRKIAEANETKADLRWSKFGAVYQDVVNELWAGDEKVVAETLRQNLEKLPVWQTLVTKVLTLKSRN